jgi:hypothetical protein
MAIAMLLSLSIVGADRAELGHVSQSALSMFKSIDFSAVAQQPNTIGDEIAGAVITDKPLSLLSCE